MGMKFHRNNLMGSSSDSATTDSKVFISVNIKVAVY